MARGPELGQVVDSLPALVSVVGADRRYTYANAAYEAWFGLRPEEVVGRHMRDVLGPEAYEALEARVDAALQGATQEFCLEAPYRRGARGVRGHYVPQRDADGAVAGFVALITPTQQTEGQRLVDLQDFVENANIGMHWVDADGRIVWLNQFELEMMGYEAHEVLGQPIRDFHADPETADAFVATLAAGGRLDREPARLRRKDGSIIDVEVSSTARFEDGRFLHTRCFTTDVTQVRRQERARKRSQTRLKRRQRQQAALVAFSHGALTAPDEQALFSAAQTALEVVGAERMGLLETLEHGFRLRFQHGWGDFPVGKVVPREQAPQAAYTVQKGEPVVVTDFSTETRFAANPIVQQADVQRSISVPILMEGRVWGILGTHGERMAKDDASFVQAVGNVIAGALQRLERESELVDAMRRSAMRERQQEAVAQLGRVALAASDMASVHAAAAKCIAHTLEHEFVAVLRRVAEADAVELVAQVGWGEEWLGGRTPVAEGTQIAYTLRTDGVVLVPDLAADDRFRGHEALHTEGVVSGMSITVPGDGAPWGVITTHSRRRTPYTIEHAHFLESVATLLAHAERRVAGEEAMRRANDELTQVVALNRELTDLGQRMGSLLDVDLLTQLVTDQATRLAGAGFGAFFFNVERDGGDEYMLYKLSGVPKEHFEGFPMPRKTAVFAPTFDGKATVRSDDITKEPMYGQTPPHHGPPPGHLPVRSYLAVPVKGRSGHVIGGLFLGHPQPARFGDTEQQAVEAIAGMAAVALENARLYEETRRSEREARAASERALAADRRKDEFLAMLGHELRNPLAPIQISLDLLERRGQAPLREHQVIRRQVKHLIQLVDDLLDISRITRGKVQLDLAPVQVADVVGRALEMAQPLVEQRRHRLDVEVDPHLHVEGDFERLAQVVANLLTNAAKYTDPGGRIRLHAADVDGEAVLSVQDSGIGIETDLLPHVFELFRQGKQAPDRAMGGLGLGLAIVQNLVSLHGGTVKAASGGKGQGSTFTVRLPAVEAPVRLVEPSTPVEDVEGAARVLVVDDNRDVAESLRDIVATMGHDVRLALDGPTALRLAAEFHPEVVLLDIGLPIMDGYELAAELRRLRGPEVRLVAISGYGGQQDRQRSREAGIDEHLVKPVTFDEVQRALVPLPA